MAHQFDKWMQSPICEVLFEGWVSNTYDLQRAGWEVSAEQDPHRDSVRLALYHRKSGLQALTNQLSYRQTIAANFARGSKPFLQFRVVCMSTVLRAVMIPWAGGAASWTPVDCTPRLSDEVDLKDLIPFRPVNPDAKEIIVAPSSVPQVLELLLKCQEPVMEKVRRHERQRAAADIAVQVVTAA